MTPMTPTTYQKLLNKHVLIIGGSSGLGAGVAEASLASGAYVTIASSSQVKIDATIARLRGLYPDLGPKIQGVVVDLSFSSSTTEAGINDPDRVLEEKLHHLFLVAPTLHSSPETTEQREINHVILTAADALSFHPLSSSSSLTPSTILAASHFRLILPLILAKVSAQHLPPSSTSSLTLTSGSLAEKPAPGCALTSYFAGGLVSLAKALAVEMKPVRVNVVRAGVVDTELWSGSLGDNKREEMMRGVRERSLTGREGKVEDVVEGYMWLMRDGNATGSVAGSDGGVLIV
ncbi:short chain dehydrogenase [Sordaria brevicollis]|uniref:Short chain dehydrogenase n=1 Tax=Sordaria brevicollis TaxID=83679 RepID=A0AAE0P9T4_SORBR|nr:short chain dehydrogenase [Sordaria brevicollis]